MTVYQFCGESMTELVEGDDKAVSVSLARSSKFSGTKLFLSNEPP